MITRTFQKGCEWCGATGYVQQWYGCGIDSSLTNICPVCHGCGTVTVTETENGPAEATFKVDDNQLMSIIQRRDHNDYKLFTGEG